MISIRTLSALFFNPDLKETQEYKSAEAACDTAVPFADQLASEQLEERNKAWRAHAEAVHSQVVGGAASLEKKAEEAFKFTAGLVTALVAITFTAKPQHLTAWFIVAMCLWLLAAFVFGLMRRGISVPGLPNAQRVRDRIFYPDSYDRWMGEVIHLLSVELRLLSDIRTEQLNLGISLLLAGMVFLAIHIGTVYVRMALLGIT